MGLWQGILVGALFVGALFVPACLARLWRWLKANGVFDLDQKRATGSCFVLLQEMVEPRIKHVLQMKEKKEQRSQADANEDDAAPDSSKSQSIE